MSSTQLPRKSMAIVDGDDEDLMIESVGASPGWSPYEYQPLPRGDYFRVLEILPGKPKSSLLCTITPYNLDTWNKPPYKALSYTWGESRYDHLTVAGERLAMDSDLRRRYDIRHPLYCDGRRLLISTNLRDALRGLRHPSLPTQLWVDALCINQQDDIERSSQIMLMPRIYHHASRVLLWLGEAVEDTEPAFDTVRQLTQQLERLNRERTYAFGSLGPETLHDDAFTDHIGLPPFASGVYGPFMRLLDRPVFRRIWCVQEAAVARTVVVRCGPQRWGAPDIAYTDIATLCSFFRRAGWAEELQRVYVDGRDVLFFPTAVMGTRANWFLHHIDRNLLLYEMRSFQATDPRDMIFALLGLLNDHSHRRVDTLGVSCDDQCIDGNHTINCAHSREKMRETVEEFAESKWEQRGGVASLWYAANSRIYGLVDLLVGFFETVKVLLESIRECTSIHGTLELETVNGHRAEADAQYIRIRKFLDKMSNQFVSSDELVSYRWASISIERCVTIYDEVHYMYTLGTYNLGNFGFPGVLLAEVDVFCRMMRREGEYASSSAFSSSVSDHEDENDESETKIQHEDGGNRGNESEHKNMLRSKDEGVLKDDLTQELPGDSKPLAQLTLEDPVLPSTSGGKYDQTVSSSEHESSDHGDDHAGKGVTRSGIDDEIEHFGDTEDISDHSVDGSDAWMAVSEHEIPAELYLAAHLSPQGDVKNAPHLKYMAPRRDPERPVLTSEPIHPWNATMSLLPDYSLSTAEVYLGFSLQCLLTDQKLDLLSAVDGFEEGRQIKDLPTWVPDFSVSLSDRIASLVQPSAYREDIWNSCAGTQPKISWNAANPRVLRLEGFCVDTIATVSALRADTYGFESFHQEWQRLTGLSGESPSTITHSEVTVGAVGDAVITTTKPAKVVHPGFRIDASDLSFTTSLEPPPPPPTVKSWSDLLYGWVYPGAPAEDRPKTVSTKPFECYCAVLAFLGIQQSGAKFSNDVERLLLDGDNLLGSRTTKDKSYITRVIRLLAIGRRMVYTKKDYVVFAPERTQPGDCVCILKGGKVPFMLRQKARSRDQQEGFELIGECHCQEMMVGQMVEEFGHVWTSILLE